MLAVVFAFLGGLLAIPLGHVALHRIKRSGAGGWDAAVIALIVGYVVATVYVLVGVFILSTSA